MSIIKKIAHHRHISEQEALLRLDRFLIVAQVYLAELEDAIDRHHFGDIVKYAHKIACEASALELHAITAHTEHLEIIATFRRPDGYGAPFEALRDALFDLHKILSTQRELSAG